MLVDTHAHLNFQDFQKDLDQVVKRSVKAGVNKIICVSSNLEDSRQAIQIAQKYSGIVFAAVGIHPHNTSPKNPKTSQNPNTQIEQLAKLATAPEVVAIGECGLDYSPAPPGEKDRSNKEQHFLFQEQIKLAIQLNKPLLVHSRKAFQETINTLRKYLPDSTLKENDNHIDPTFKVPLRGVFHCYSAGKKGIEQVNKLGFSAKGGPATDWYFGVDGNLTYDEGLQNVFTQIPLEKILLETDCPFLAPEPFRSQRSEPAHVKIIAEYLAKIKNVSLKKVTKTTTQNAEKLFGI